MTMLQPRVGLTLDPTVWPRTAGRVGGVLAIGGVDVRDLALEYGTPAYVLDEDDFRERCRQWRVAFRAGAADGDVYYAGKAFLCVAVARWVAAEGLSLDVCTGGELAGAERAGFPADRILFHGNNKSVEELGRAGTTGVATGQEDQKFGFSLAAGAAAEAVRRVLALPSLELVGLHCHIGSQIFDTSGFRLAAHRMVGLLAEVRAEHGVELPELNLGGGLGIAYTSEDAPLPVEEVADRLRAVVTAECATAGLAVPRLGVEPGRAVSGPTTVTLYEVGTAKELPGLRTYVSVDGGMSDNIRTALYDAHYTAVLASRTSTAPPRVVTVCGKHCESGDIVVHDVALAADLAPGDLLAVPASGAYHRSMASNYNHVPRPPVIAVRNGQARVLVRRETEDDLLRLDTAELDTAELDTADLDTEDEA